MSVEKLIGSWELKSKIGSGGNGEVWECTDQTGNAFAMKILTKTTGEAYQRFLDEVKVMLSHQGADGMLPVIDFNLHELNGSEQTEKIFTMLCLWQFLQKNACLDVSLKRN